MRPDDYEEATAGLQRLEDEEQISHPNSK